MHEESIVKNPELEDSKRGEESERAKMKLESILLRSPFVEHQNGPLDCWILADAVSRMNDLSSIESSIHRAHDGGDSDQSSRAQSRT